MLKTLDDLPDGVLGFEADGEIGADDYRKVLLPALQQQLAAGHDVRVVLVFRQWDGMTGGALWQDLKMGVDNLTRWKKIALVTDVDWMRHATRLFGWMTPGEMRHFPMAERDAAIAWAGAKS
jgi:hypothetical protein